ncbi:MAG: ABC transporter ATP-binding protein [Candidatus Ornithospirochaeta sp.]|nr:ABC transporter ATP-binding protein [Candidatus Ornithospirochaeta sp.]
MKVLETENLCGNSYIRNVSLSVEEGEFAAVMGPSGSGKSTLLYLVSGIMRCESGRVLLRGRDLSKLKERELYDIRRKEIGFVFQNPELIPELNAVRNILLPSFDRNRKRAEELLALLGLEGFADRSVEDLSGGEKQRVSIARALINSPSLILADEPTGALNRSSALETMDVFLDMKRRGNTILMVTHDSKIASFADRILYLEDGTIKAEYRNSSKSEDDVRSFLSENGW